MLYIQHSRAEPDTQRSYFFVVGVPLLPLGNENRFCLSVFDILFDFYVFVWYMRADVRGYDVGARVRTFVRSYVCSIECLFDCLRVECGGLRFILIDNSSHLAFCLYIWFGARFCGFVVVATRR